MKRLVVTGKIHFETVKMAKNTVLSEYWKKPLMMSIYTLTKSQVVMNLMFKKS